MEWWYFLLIGITLFFFAGAGFMVVLALSWVYKTFIRDH